MRYTFSTCEAEVIPVEGVTAVFQRGYWWHAPCLSVARWEAGGRPVVAFPSAGKLVPESIVGEGGDSDEG